VEIDVAAEDAGFRGMFAPCHIFHVNVKYAVVKLADELDVIDTLVTKVGGIIIKPERRMAIEGIERALR
jgi:hypothetical protein